MKNLKDFSHLLFFAVFLITSLSAFAGIEETSPADVQSQEVVTVDETPYKILEINVKEFDPYTGDYVDTYSVRIRDAQGNIETYIVGWWLVESKDFMKRGNSITEAQFEVFYNSEIYETIEKPYSLHSDMTNSVKLLEDGTRYYKLKFYDRTTYFGVTKIFNLSSDFVAEKNLLVSKFYDRFTNADIQAFEAENSRFNKTF